MIAVTRGLKRLSRRLGNWSRSWEAKEKTRTARVFGIGLVGVLSDVSPAAVAKPPGSAEVWAEGPAWTEVAKLAVIAAGERAVTRAVGLVLIRAVGLVGTAVGAPVLTAAVGPVATRVEELAEAGARVAPQAGDSAAVGFAAAAEPDEPAAAFE